ncbi:MAG: hypothetical protein ABI776_15905 [Nocardioidaceae bacterium]
MPYADWAGARCDLTRTLEQLADGEFLLMGEPLARSSPRRRLFARRHQRSPGPGPAPSRYVQALRVADVLSAECVGALGRGGTWEMADTTVEQLRSLGWLTPTETLAAYAVATPNFAQHVDLTGAAALADLMVASLALLGTSPSALTLQTSEGGLRAVGD